MARYLTNVVETYRVATEEEVETFLKELKDDPKFTLSAFSYKKKEIKSKGEVIEEYYLVSVKKEFNIEKEPTNFVDITYEVN